jgi:hypothetical protein
MAPQSAATPNSSMHSLPGEHLPLQRSAAASASRANCRSGVIYRNPKPHVRAIHAWHPTLISLGGERLLATFDLGEAVEALDYRTYSSYSEDGGVTWSPPSTLFDDPHPRPSTHSIRSARLRDGSLVAVGGRYFRDDPDEGICNRANMGLVEMELFLLRSGDEGRTWSGPEPLIPPLVGPAFEVAHGIVELSDGRWLWPTSTWKAWDGTAPNGMKAVALVSRDRGKTWPEYIDIFDGFQDGIIHFEQSLVVLPNGRLLDCAWALDTTGRTRDVVYSISNDAHYFRPSRSTGLPGETSKLLALGDGRVVCFFRSLDEPGLGAALIEVQGYEWLIKRRIVAWRGPLTGMLGELSPADGLGELKLGYPSPILLPDGTVLCGFWCRVNEVNEIRWVHFSPDWLDNGVGEMTENIGNAVENGGRH